MKSNQIPKRPDEVFSFAESAASGLDLYEAQLGIKQNTAAEVRLRLNEARAAQEAFQAARSRRAGIVTPEASAADQAVARFLTEARKSLTFHLGVRWNERWSEAGFVNPSTAIPRSPEGRESMIAALAGYFGKHPEHELPGLGVTAQAGQELHARLLAARKAANSHVADQGTLRGNRDAALSQLRRRLMATVGELRLLLDPDSKLWEAFGLTTPGRRGNKGNVAQAPSPLQAVGAPAPVKVAA